MIDAAKLANRLGWLWLREIDAPILTVLHDDPRFAAAVTGLQPSDLDELAAEHQRLLSFNVPPHESLFLDPSAMLGAPATTRVIERYRRMGFAPPPTARAAAADHLGLELLALSEALTRGNDIAAKALIAEHLALWLPPWVDALMETSPPPIYRRAAQETLELVLGAVDHGMFDQAEPFPRLPPAPEYQGTGMGSDQAGFIGPDEGPDYTVDTFPFDDGSSGDFDRRAGADSNDRREPDDQDATNDNDISLHQLVRMLLVPRQTGLWLGRADALNLGRSLGLPAVVGGRDHMVTALLLSAGGEGLASAALSGLVARVDRSASRHETWSDAYPAWTPVGTAWRERVARTRTMLSAWAAKANAEG